MLDDAQRFYIVSKAMEYIRFAAVLMAVGRDTYREPIDTLNDVLDGLQPERERLFGLVRDNQ